ncbi:MAG TPA: SET domain-containing protein [Ferruginibacter sp.]|nr:SET domain-containing protein [Ferruginibacter sp.]
MALNAKKHLVIKRSSIPNAGKGLFTKVFIPKGQVITEYKGKITTWEDADHDDGKNLYIYYVNKHYVIDAKNRKSALARYANDGNGFKKTRGNSNNSTYIIENNRVFIKAIKNIQPGSEILVSYGRTYWNTLQKLN